MDSTNRMNGKANLQALSGGIPLDGHFLKSRVEEIIAARMAEPFDRLPTVGEIVQITHRGKVQNIDVNVVRGALEERRWEIKKTLREFGVDESEGEWSCVPHALGALGDGTPSVQFLLTWTPREKATKPSLVT